MAAVTSAGLWPVPAAAYTYTARAVHVPVKPRQNIPASAVAVRAVAATPATAVPAAPAFTRFPVTP